MTAMLSLRSSKNIATSSSSANVHVTNNVTVDGGGSDSEVRVSYKPQDNGNPYTEVTLKELSQKAESLEALCEVQKAVIQMMMDNPLKANGYIIADDVTLMHFIKLLTKAKDVDMDVEDIGQGCVTRRYYRKVNSIYTIHEDGRIENAKYAHADVMKILKDLRISTKFVF